MKLTNMQLEAVVSKIYDAEVKKETAEYKKKLATYSKKNQVLAKKYYKSLCLIPSDIREVLYIRKTEKDILYSLNKKSMGNRDEYSIERKTKNDIRERVLIASIETESLVGLQAKLGIKL